jgi:NhaP-type Na+/H+ or K+/H+ antiporter
MKEDLLGSLGESAVGMASMDAHLLLYTFLPPLIFESAFNVHETHFQKVKFAALTYAGPGLLICTGLTACVVLLFYPAWEW